MRVAGRLGSSLGMGVAKTANSSLYKYRSRNIEKRGAGTIAGARGSDHCWCQRNFGDGITISIPPSYGCTWLSVLAFRVYLGFRVNL